MFEKILKKYREREPNHPWAPQYPREDIAFLLKVIAAKDEEIKCYAGRGGRPSDETLDFLKSLPKIMSEYSV